MVWIVDFWIHFKTPCRRWLSQGLYWGIVVFTVIALVFMVIIRAIVIVLAIGIILVFATAVDVIVIATVIGLVMAFGVIIVKAILIAIV